MPRENKTLDYILENYLCIECASPLKPWDQGGDVRYDSCYCSNKECGWHHRKYPYKSSDGVWAMYMRDQPERKVFFDGDGVCAYKGKKLDNLSKEELIKIIKEMGLAYLRIHATTA